MTPLESAFAKVHRQLKPRTPLPVLQTEFFPSVGANHSATLEKGVLTARVSDLFRDAPPEILEAVAAILLSKLYRKKVDTHYQREYRQYTLSPDMIERSRQVRTQRGRPSPVSSPEGRHYNLTVLFETLNTRHFGGRLPKPGLSWTPKRARTILGRYDFDQDVIFISRFLDSEKVPEYVVSYVLFHEMLHAKHGTEIEDLREVAHTPAFRREEKQFPHYTAARDWIETH